MKAVVLTISDRASAGVYDDESGPALAAILEEAGHEVVESRVIPDERDQIADAVAGWADGGAVQLIVTTGGTGLGPRDVTPEAIEGILEKQAPGLGEAMRAYGRERTPFASLSRQVAGTRGRALILALPGSPRAAVESLEAVIEIVPHAVEML